MFLAFWLGFSAMTAASEKTATYSLEPVADKGVTTGNFKDGLHAQDPEGKAAVVWVSQLVWWEVNHMLIKFDLSQLPKNQQVKKAFLELHVTELQGKPTKVRIATLKENYDLWEEATATFDQRDGKNIWSDGYLNQSVWTVSDPQLVSKSGVWCRWEVTSVIRDWHVGKVFNNGFVLQADYPMNHWGDLTNSPGRVGFHTRQERDASFRPRLIVEMQPLPTGIKPSQFPPQPTKPSELLRLPKPPYVIWFQCPYLDDIRHCNVDASVGTSSWAFKNHTRGITSLMWTFGPNSPYAEKGREREFFLNQYSDFARAGYTGCAVDEWNVSDENPNVAWCAEGLRQTKKDFPDYFIAVWVTGPTPTFIALMKEGIIDLAIIEGYSYCPDHPEWAISWEDAMQRIEILKREGLLSKTVFCVGEVAAKPDQFGNRMTPGELTRQVTFIAEHYPEMPGIAFFGWNDQDPKTKELVLLADQLAGRLFVVK